MSRPEEYNDDVQTRADEYLKIWKDIGDAIPSVAGLSCFLGISKSTTYLWKDKYPKFSDTLRMILTYQERVALNGGLLNDFNSTITKLVLANHGYHDKVETKTELSFENLSDEELKQRIQSILNEQ